MRSPSTSESSGRWTNRHHNVSLGVERLVDVWNPLPPQPTTVLADIRATTSLLQELIAECAAAGKELRPVGGTWSLSHTAASPHLMLNTKPLNLRFPIAPSSVQLGSSFASDSLFYFQCGNSVGEVYSYLERKGRTLRTSGASNGQTIVGAVTTGTHGSAFSFGSMPEMVAAIHVITGPHPQDVLWLERATDPVLSHSFTTRIGARLVRNNELFNAALVSFGNCGLVMGLLVSAPPMFKLRSIRRTVPLSGAVQRLMTTLDLSVLPSLIPDLLLSSPVTPPATSPPPSGVAPTTDSQYPVVHVEVVINPHNADGNVHLTVMQQVPMSMTSSPQHQPTTVGPGDDVLGLIGLLADVLPGVVPDAARTFITANYGDVGPTVATPGETFHATDARGSATSVEIGVPLDRTMDALAMIMAQSPEIDAYAGVIAIRYVKQTQSLLGFAQFPITATIELPGAMGRNTLAFYDAVFAAFESNSIPYTIHWGQVAPARPETLAHLAGNVVRWKAAREQLLSADMRSVFSNEMSRAFGLT